MTTGNHASKIRDIREANILRKGSQYKEAIKAAHVETQMLLRKRAQIDTRLMKLKRTIEALSRLIGHESEPEESPAELAGFSKSDGATEAIRKVLVTHGGPLSPMEIRGILNHSGFPINEYASGLAVIYNTLKRLEKQGKATLLKSPNGTTAYPVPSDE